MPVLGVLCEAALISGCRGLRASSQYRFTFHNRVVQRLPVRRTWIGKVGNVSQQNE